MTIAVKERKQNMLLTREEIKLIERLRQLCRRSGNCLIIVRPGAFVSWWVTDKEES